jgi:hypothetical protein
MSVPPNNPVTPTGSFDPYNDASKIKYLAQTDRPDRDRVHIVPKMHVKIAFLQWVGFLALIYVGYIFGDFWHSQYFSFGPPVMTASVTIKSEWEYWLKIVLFAVDRLVMAAGIHVVTAWKERIVFSEARPPHELQNYWLVMFVLLTDRVVNWMRYAVLVVFLYAQFDFALAMAIPDVLIACGTNVWSIMRYEKKHRECRRPQPQIQPQSPLKKLDNEDAAFNISPVAVTILQWIMVLAYVLVFYFTDFFASPYFYFSTPFVLFGRTFKNWRKLVGFLVFAFADSVIASMYSSIVGPYIVTYILNNSSVTVRYSTSGARFIYLGKRIFGWVRIVFMLSFTNSKFMFLLAMFLGDFMVTIFMTHRAVSRRHGLRAQKDALAAMPLSALGVTIAVLFELTIVIVVFLAQLKIHKMPYFDFPPPLVLFEVIVTSRVDVVFVILYTVFDRAIYTLSTEITAPYLSNVLYPCDLNGMRYTVPELLLITFTNDFTNWVRRIVAFNFQLSNYSLVLFQGVTDVGLAEIIFKRYTDHKMLEGGYNESRRRARLREHAEKPGTELKEVSSLPGTRTGNRAPRDPHHYEDHHRDLHLSRTLDASFPN